MDRIPYQRKTGLRIIFIEELEDYAKDWIRSQQQQKLSAAWVEFETHGVTRTVFDRDVLEYFRGIGINRVDEGIQT